MKHIRRFELFESERTLTDEQKEFLNKYVQGGWMVNPKTGLVDVRGNFHFPGKKLKTLLGIKFGVVSRDFNCFDNQLTSLEGAPQKVGGNFNCSNNQITSLEGAPQKVGGNFNCYKNGLTTLMGAPQKVGGSFSCSNNKLTSLEGAPREVGDYFFCFNNRFTSLKGAPERVGDDFYLELEDGFKWTTEGKLEYMREDPKWAPLIAPTLPYDSLLDAVSESPALLKTIEDSDKVLYNKLLKDLGWDKMGPDLLRQLKDGIL